MQIEAGHKLRQKHYTSLVQSNEKHTTTTTKTRITNSKYTYLKCLHRERE